LINKAVRSIAKTVGEVEDHLDDGGSIGLAMRMEGVPAAPVPLVVFDCDKAGAEDWLHERVAPSPLASRGRIGMHDYRVIPGGVPALKSDTSSLNPGRVNPANAEKPGIDVKVSGLVVMAFSQNKTLWWNGQDISADPAAVAAVFGGSLDSFLAMLPHTDPRGIAPMMREHLPPAAILRLVPSGAGGSRNGQAQSPLSDYRPLKQDVEGGLQNVAYHHRKRLAGRFLLRAAPAVEGKNPDGTMFRVVVALIRHYAVSEQDALMLIKKWFNDRCTDAQGASYPYGDRQLIHMFEGARTAAYDPVGHADADGYELNVAEMHANHRRRDRRSNQRRNLSRKVDAAFEAGCVLDFLGECCVVTSADSSLVNQRDIYDACHDWVRQNRWGITITDKRIGQVLNSEGIGTKRFGHAKTIYRVGIDFDKLRAA
jgi:hypothetical protein